MTVRIIRNESKIRDLDDQKGAATSAEAQRYNQESLNENTAEYRDIVKKTKKQVLYRTSSATNATNTTHTPDVVFLLK